MKNFNQLIGRYNRRKEAKIGRFVTDKYVNDKIVSEKTEYNVPNLRESQIERKKDEIRTEIKRQKIKTWLILALFAITLVYIFFTN